MKNAKILIVDDRPENLYALEKILGETGAEIIKAGSGNEALIASLRHEFALAVVDVQMPDMDGYELAELLRSQNKTRRLPLIFLSAVYSDEYHIFRGYEAGAVDFITKPYHPVLLLSKVHMFLELEMRVAERTEELARANEALRMENIERRQAEEQLKIYMKKLEQSNQCLQEFAFIASHDMQEPLRKVRTFGNLLKDKYGSGLGEGGRDYVERMLSATHRMQSILEGLLHYSRVDTKAEPLVEIKLNDLVREVLSNLEVRIAQTGGRVEVGDLPDVRADPRQMYQLFQNLIGNALKFHKEDEKPFVRVSGVAAGNGRRCHEIVVEDNGIGFEVKYLDRIFVPFQRLHGRTSRFEGTGMGLAICKKIVERHGGSITARSEPGKGATFIIGLPGGPGGRNGW